MIENVIKVMKQVVKDLKQIIKILKQIVKYDIWQGLKSFEIYNLNLFSAPMPLTSAITAASVLALALIMLVCTCIVCRNRRKLCFKGNITTWHITLWLLGWTYFNNSISFQWKLRRILWHKTVSPTRQNQKFLWWMRPKRNFLKECLLWKSILILPKYEKAREYLRQSQNRSQDVRIRLSRETSDSNINS